MISNGFSSVQPVRDVIHRPDIDAASSIITTADGRISRSSVELCLKSVLPASISEEIVPDASFSPSKTRVFTSPLHRQILFSVANNFAACGALPISAVFQYLQVETDAKLSQLIFHVSGYTSRAIARNIFRAAVEVGDFRIVESLLENRSVDIDINKSFYTVRGVACNAVGRASHLGHLEVVRSLLQHGACSDNALTLVKGPRDDFSRLDPQIFGMLLETGSNLDPHDFHYLFTKNHRELISVAIKTQAYENHIKWNEWGIFRSAVLILDDRHAMRTIEILLDTGANLNIETQNDAADGFKEQTTKGGTVSPKTVLDAAARRGNLTMVDVLLKSGASLTGDTLTWAIISEDETLIQFLLARGADIQTVGSSGFTPFERAIRLNNSSILQLLQVNGAFFDSTNQSQLSAAICAAAEAGNIELIEHLIELGGGSAVPCLSEALPIAIEWGHDEVATLIIAAGADVNANRTSRKPLTQALESQDTALVFSLLDADAVPHGDDLILAVHWGNRSVVETLILAGADVTFGAEEDTPLQEAVRRRNYDLVQLLLDAGADLTTELGYTGSALTVALKLKDVRMACYLLDRGADLLESAELGELMMQDKHFLEAVLQKHEVRYPLGRKGFGSNALSLAVESGAVPLVRLMLEKGLDTASFTYSQTPHDGIRYVTPFGRAILGKHCNAVEIVELFLQKNCDPNGIVAKSYEWPQYWPQCTWPQYTALLLAIISQDLAKIKLLLRYQASVNFPAKRGVKRTPLQRAAEIGNLQIVELLIDHGADVHALPAWSGGGTALQLAAIGGYIPLVCRLINFGADVNAPGAKVHGRTALEGAAEHGRVDMVQVLLNAGAGAPGSDQRQVQNAKELAKEKGWPYIADLIEDYFSPETNQPEGNLDDDMLNDS